MKKHRQDNTELLFNIYSSETQEQIAKKYYNDSNIKKYRTKSIKSGPMLEVEIFPIWDTTKKNINQLIEKTKQDKAHMANVNHKNKQKRMIRMLNENFTENDIWLTLGYKTGKGKIIKITREQALKDMQRYIRRLRNLAKKLGYPPLKYIYVIEEHKNGSAHMHMVTNFKDRDKAEQTWNGGEYPQSRRLKISKDFGLEGLARYISKDLTGQNTYYPSTNLKKPWLDSKCTSINDNKMSKTKCQKLIKEDIKPREYFEKQYPNYDFIAMEYKTSSFVDGYYLYIKMAKKAEDKKPKIHKKANAKRA